MEQATNRQVRYTSTGEEILFRPSGSVRFSRTFTSVIRIAIAAPLLRWIGPELKVYFERRELTGVLQILERFNLSDSWMFATVVASCVILAWWILGSIFEILTTHLKRDLFLLRSDGLFVKRRKIIPREFQFKSYDPLELRLRPQDGWLEAKDNKGSYVLTDGGTSEDREWLMEFLEKRFRFPKIQTGTSTVENVATYKVERRPDQSVLISSSAQSRIGCASLAAFICTALLVLSIWQFSKGSGAGMVLLFFFVAVAIGGLFSLNRRSVEASRGHLLVKWSSPVGSLLKRFISMEQMLHSPIGAGEYRREAGVFRLKTVKQSKGEPSYKIFIANIPAPESQESVEIEEKATDDDVEMEEIDEEHDFSDPMIEEEMVLDFTSSSRPAAEYILSLLSETTGFPSDQS